MTAWRTLPDYPDLRHKVPVNFCVRCQDDWEQIILGLGWEIFYEDD